MDGGDQLVDDEQIDDDTQVEDDSNLSNIPSQSNLANQAKEATGTYVNNGKKEVVILGCKRAGDLTSASARTGFSPPLKKLNTDSGLGLAGSAQQACPPQ